MAIVGFGFTKMEVERKKPLSARINIKNNIAIKDVSEHKFSTADAQMNKDRKGIKFVFEFVSNYEPGSAMIRLTGELFFIGTKKQGDEILNSWKKDKKVPKEVMPSVLNYCLSRSNVEAISLSKDVGLPPPLPMPKVTSEKAENSYIG